MVVSSLCRLPAAPGQSPFSPRPILLRSSTSRSPGQSRAPRRRQVLPWATEGTWGSASPIPMTTSVALRVGSSSLERSYDGWFRAFRSFRLQGSMSPALGKCLSCGMYRIGGIEGEEDSRIAAFRELKEETGVTSAEILAEVPYWLTYDFPPEAKEKLNKLWG
ncbi:hypothetical protein ZIOFF_026455 [Zingiber officinale]|uniref:Nudix hydrolase domain-containing protein n=1 Tax=Zingiber officinale TaxID=94328 RepID=A0A8J5GWE1_ZINOF|nr:hypothetical protein ZIOFF_026455 [Zingiber officinale]